MDLGTMVRELGTGMLITTEIFVLTLVFSLPLGMVLAFGRMARLKVLSFLTKLYISIMRGTPLMLQLIVVYFAPYYVFGMKISKSYRMIAVILAFVLNYAAYFAEIFRGGIIGVSKGQYEASKALGLTGIQTMRYVIVPQMIRTVIPPIANETIVLVKDTALASSIALIDLLKAAQRAVNRDMRVSPYLVAALFYLVITLILTFGFNYVEKRLSICLLYTSDAADE